MLALLPRSFASGALFSVVCVAHAVQVEGDSPAMDEIPPESDSETEITEIIVTGEQPGPGLWKVSAGDNVVWILGTVPQLPKDVTWKSKVVEDAIKSSAEVLTGVRPNDESVDPITMLQLARAFRKAEREPNGKNLKDVVPQELYERFSLLKKKYAAGDDVIEKLRPSLAGSRLYIRGVEANAGVVVSREIVRLAKAHRVKVRSIDAPGRNRDEVVASMRESTERLKKPADLEIACLDQSVSALEASLHMIDQRAQAWAVGNLEALRRRRSALALACGNSDPEQTRADLVGRDEWWRKGIEDALGKNSVTFALYPVDRLLDESGPLAQLRAAGYAIEAPI